MKTLLRVGIFGVMVMGLVGRGFGAGTEVVYLSGKGNDDGVKWDFWCSAGQNAEKWGTINVPSNWELQGYGIYSYGRDGNRAGWPKVQGKYKRTFTPPPTWAQDHKVVFLTFEGSMTDTQAFINGKSAGPMHQGGYYRFQYDITTLLKPGENLLEVTVDDESANASVNNAERRGDYWNYAGIFRPVHLDALPQPMAIQNMAINARADGTITVDLETLSTGGIRDDQAGPAVEIQVLDLDGKPVGNLAREGELGTHFAGKINAPRLWTAETPNLYQLEARLKMGNTIIHSVTQKFGFRTIEAKAGEGVLLNGKRIMFKGADRHSFWPDSGRCLSEKISRDDILLMKEMNMNAVRCSHYPPDQHFLDLCDEMGMYVLDELGGWHAAYDTPTGHRLVQEMVTRDVNHPSVVFWDNGNEGGWNTALDDDFAKWDPQKRNVLHPQQNFRGIDTNHYPAYNTVVTRVAGQTPYFPTEMLHGLYDGGAGAGLEDYWRAMEASKVSAGGFIWALVDEDVKRTDLGGKLDSKTNQAPDGIVGPYREREGSFYTVKQLWSPVQMLDDNFSETIRVENRFDFTDLQKCTFSWELWKYAKPGDAKAGHRVIFTSSAAAKGSIPPGKSGTLAVRFPPTSAPYEPGDAEALTAKDPAGRELWTWVWPIGTAKTLDPAETVAGSGSVKVNDGAEEMGVTAGDLVVRFSKKTGEMVGASRAGKGFSLINGPRVVEAGSPVPPPAGAARGAVATPAPPLPESKLEAMSQKMEGNDVVVSTAYSGSMKSVTTRVRPNGWVTVDYVYTITGAHELFGVGFEYPEAKLQGMRYMGSGPYTVYQNRLVGGTLDVWDKKYNDTMVGNPDDLKVGEHFDYPVFKGYYAGVRWMTLRTSEGPITAVVPGGQYVQVFAPKTAGDIGQTGVPYPSGGISFLDAIPAIGSKFNRATTSGPMGQPAVAKGDYKGSVSLYFGEVR